MSGKSIPASDQYPEQEIITDSAVEGEAQARLTPRLAQVIQLNCGIRVQLEEAGTFCNQLCPARSVVADQGSSTVRSSALFAWKPVENRNAPRSRLAAPCRLRRRHVHNPDGFRSGEACCARNPRAQPRFDRQIRLLLETVCRW